MKRQKIFRPEPLLSENPHTWFLWFEGVGQYYFCQAVLCLPPARGSPGWLALFLPHHRLLYGPAVPPSSRGHLDPCEWGAGPFALWLGCKGLAYLAPCCQPAPVSRLHVLASAWERGGLHRWGHHWGRTGLPPGLPRWRVTIPSSKSGCCVGPLLLVPNRSLEHVNMCAAALSLFLSLFPSFYSSGKTHSFLPLLLQSAWGYLKSLLSLLSCVQFHGAVPQNVPKIAFPHYHLSPGLWWPWSCSRPECRNECAEAGMRCILYSGHALMSLYFVQAAFSLRYLNRSGSYRDNLYSYLGWILVAGVADVMWVSLSLEAMYSYSCSQKAQMRGATSNGCQPDLSTVCAQLHCFLTWAGLSAQHMALPCRLMSSVNPAPPRNLGPVHVRCRLEGLWEVCRWMELLGILLFHTLEWEPIVSVFTHSLLLVPNFCLSSPFLIPQSLWSRAPFLPTCQQRCLSWSLCFRGELRCCPQLWQPAFLSPPRCHLPPSGWWWIPLSSFPPPLSWMPSRPHQEEVPAPP